LENRALRWHILNLEMSVSDCFTKEDTFHPVADEETKAKEVK
jgi:hypothetical protein